MNSSDFADDIELTDLRQWAISVLSSSGVADAEVDSDLLIGHVLELSRGQVSSKLITGSTVAGESALLIRQLVNRRAQREPLQHILGVAWFRSLTLFVGPGVFVPRPETEQLAGIAIDALRASADPAPIGIDLGSGSGAIALAMAAEVPHSRIYAIEKSPEALPWISKNFSALGSANAHLVPGDLAGEELLSTFPELEGNASVIASNPPYIPDSAIPRDPEVHLFDPAMALYGGEDGLDVVRQVSKVALILGRSGSQLILEHGELQGSDIREILSSDGWRAVSTQQDLVGRDRFTLATKN